MCRFWKMRAASWPRQRHCIASAAWRRRSLSVVRANVRHARWSTRAAASRRARVVSLLLGSHPRAGAGSPLSRLPLVLLRVIAEKAGLAGRLPITVLIDPAAAPAAAPPPAAHNPGADLAAIAALVV